MSVALAVERRRAHVHRLLVHIRRFAALCLCRDLFATVRWIQSEFDTSDVESILSTMQFSQCWPGLKKNTRAIPNIVFLVQTAVRARPPFTVKSTSPDTENHYKNGYENCTYNIYSMTTNEDNHDTTYINNDTNNHDARKLHE